jgi:predicted ribosomally synthesized peptide with SipW-like signal peptide
MKKIVLSVLSIIAAVALVSGVTWAQFSNSETSNDNTFAAGTLDLNLDGGNVNVVKFTVSNMSVEDQRIGTWKLKNVGSLSGFLDLQNIAVTTKENGCLDPESDAGDVTCDNPGVGQGEMQDKVSLSKLFWDNNCNGWVEAGEATIFDGKVGLIASDYDVSRPLNAGSEQCVTGQFNWWNNGASDNLAQGDSFELDMTFELAETAAQ